MTPLQQQITELWGQITAATHRFLELVAELDEKKGWNGAGMINCAHWLNVYCGIGMVAAREKVRVAHALRLLPGINEAFRDGRVSYSKVRAMTRVATPDNEAALLNIAIHGTAAQCGGSAGWNCWKKAGGRLQRTGIGICSSAISMTSGRLFTACCPSR